jgi:hypothetical protein
MRVATRQRLADTRLSMESTRARLRRIQNDVLIRAQKRLERSEARKSESIGRELESTQRLLDDT